MIEQFPLQTVLTYLTLISVPIGVFYHIMTLRNTRRNQELTRRSQDQALETRQAQLFMGLYETYRNPEFRKLHARVHNQEWEDFDDFWEKYGSETNPEAFSEWLSVAAFFNGAGVLLQRELIDINLTGELLANILCRSWPGTVPILEGFRQYTVREGFAPPHTKLLGGFEYLYNEVMKREERLASGEKA